VSVRTGIKGEPAIAEEIMVVRDLFLAQHTESRLHINSVSTAGSLAFIKSAKKHGTPVTASVNAYSLALDDSALLEFDSNCKASPPLRGKEDIKALKKGLSEGIIDVICSDHRPEDEENKKLEFDMAAPGMLGIQTLYSLVNMYSELTAEQIVEKIAINPRRILRLEVPIINENTKANLTFYTPTEEWIPDKKTIQSLSKNTPLKGKALGILNNEMFEQT